MSRSYTFTDSHGEIHVMTLMEASQKTEDPAIKSRFEEIILNSKNRRRKKDGFEPGWQENIGRYAGGPQEYAKILKEMGLVERGNDCKIEQSEGGYNPCHTEEFAKACIEAGVELSGNEIEAIKTGEYFKDVELAE